MIPNPGLCLLGLSTFSGIASHNVFPPIMFLIFRESRDKKGYLYIDKRVSSSEDTWLYLC